MFKFLLPQIYNKHTLNKYFAHHQPTPYAFKFLDENYLHYHISHNSFPLFCNICYFPWIWAGAIEKPWKKSQASALCGSMQYKKSQRQISSHSRTKQNIKWLKKKNKFFFVKYINFVLWEISWSLDFWSWKHFISVTFCWCLMTFYIFSVFSFQLTSCSGIWTPHEFYFTCTIIALINTV